MRLLCKGCIGLLVIVALCLAACGGTGGNTTVNGTIKVQLTKVSTPNTPYLVSGMLVTLRDPKGVTSTAVTDVNGVATFSNPNAPTGIYSVTRVTGSDVTGAAVNTLGREFVKAAPISNATPWVEYAPINALVTVNAAGTYVLNAPVPEIRQVWMLKRASVTAGGNDNPYYPSDSEDDFTGRIILSHIHFNSSYSDAITIWGNGDVKFKLFVVEAQDRIANTLNGSVQLGDLATNISTWPYAGAISLEVPSPTDWAFTSSAAAADATMSRSGNAAYNFGQFAGGAMSVLSIYNNGITHTPAGTNALTYEIHRFDPSF